MVAEMVLPALVRDLKAGDRIVLANMVFRIDRIEGSGLARDHRRIHGMLQNGAPFNVSWPGDRPVVLTHLERR